MGTAYRRWRVVYVEEPKSMQCYRKSEEEALDFAGEMLRRDGVEWVEMWAVEEVTDNG